MNRVFLPVLLLITTSLSFNAFQTTAQDIAPKLIQATVEISVKEKKDDLFSHVGTGWLYENQYTIVTAKHVVDGYEITAPKLGSKEEETKHLPYHSIRITFSDGQQIIIDKLKTSKKYDVAVLTFDAKKK